MEKKIHPIDRITGTIAAPASKSYAQRALAAAMLVPAGQSASVLTGMSLCDDTSAALDVIQRLGAIVHHQGDRYEIEGGFLRNAPNELNIGEAGLATRLFTPIAAQSPSPITISGHGSILTRPLDAMEPTLLQLGASLAMTEGKYLPLTISGPLKGGQADVDGSVGSQFLTGLLMSLPLSGSDTTLRVSNLKSIPYIDMTLEVLKAFGVEVEVDPGYTTFRVPGNQTYRTTEYSVEGDWSGASCILVAGATAGTVTVSNLNPASRQADREILTALQKTGADLKWLSDRTLSVSYPKKGTLKAFEFDATDCPDLFPALAALASCCEGTTTIRGTKRLTHKESDRAATIAREYRKFGVEIDLSRDDLMIIPGVAVRPSDRFAVNNELLDSHNDHRIAMATAVTALRADRPVNIERAQAVNKSYPAFWDDLAMLSSNN